MCRNYQEYIEDIWTFHQGMENRLTVQSSQHSGTNTSDLDIHDRASLIALLESEIDIALQRLDGNAPLMMTMARYHLGITDAAGEPVNTATRLSVQGKRLRPLIAMRVAEAVGGSAEDAAPIAAAIELLHNFTLIHDDIQDRSPNRRHRPTVWRIWGNAQAINAGDALFAASQLAVLRTYQNPTFTSPVIRLIEKFNTTTINIVRGQILDLDNEGRPDVTPDDYLTMIEGKTAAIVRYATWAGAIVGGASDEVAELLGDVGEAVGMGFQIRDDMLGIWGAREDTGKDAADDIRRRKQSLPILILRGRTSDAESDRLDELFKQDEIGPEGIKEILSLLAKYDVESTVAAHVEQFYQRASEALTTALPNRSGAAIDELNQLIMAASFRRS